MPIDTEHVDYEKRKSQWQKVRDCYAGQEAIYERGSQYLPMLSGQDNSEYCAYQQRAPFYGATARTVDGLSGMIFRKPPTVEVPEGLKPMLENITLNGMSLQGFAEEIIDDDLKTGRVGILVDHPAVALGTSVAQAEAMNIRPFLKHYAAEQIFNWRVEMRNNEQVLTQVRLWEWVEKQDGDEFTYVNQKQIRVLDLTPDGKYRQRVFIEEKQSSGKNQWVQDGNDIFPLKNGAPLNMIPFFFVGVRNSQPTPEKPPLIDLAEVNISHYRSTADLEHGAHFTGLPTAVITGHSDDPQNQTVYRIGSATAWVFPQAETKVAYLEFNGQGLEALEKRVAKKEEYMAFLGARMLTPEKREVETAETAQIHRTGETSVLSSLAQSAGQAIEAALKFMSEWAGFDSKDISFKFNNDFMAVRMAAPDLLALLQLWQSGGIAFGDLLENLKRGEVVREDRTEEEIQSEVEQYNPFQLAQDDLEPTQEDDGNEI